MASKITAIRQYKPEIQLERTRQMSEVLEDMSRQTGLSTGQILHVVYELQETILSAHRLGQPIKVEALGTFTPVMRMDGSLDILFRPGVAILRNLNDMTKFHARIRNKANIGKFSEELIEQWNRDHPEDPVKG